MDDELVLLEGLYPELNIQTKGNAVELVLEHVARIGKVRLRVTVDNKQEYPQQSRPVVKIERGLSAENERLILRKVTNACDEYPSELCLVQLFGTFVSELDLLTATCGVCLDDIEDDILVTSPCAHIFHKSSCFANWALQCKENREVTAEAELNRTRRRQRENTSESEVRMAQTRVAQLDAERCRLLARKTVLSAKIQELSSQKTAPTNASLSTRKSNEKVIAEREKVDEDLLDANEAQKRLGHVNKSIKIANADLAAARKVQTSAETSLKALKDAIAIEASEEQRTSASRIPCPVCRTELDIS